MKMKATKLTYLLVCALALTMAATGCKKKPTNVTRLPDYPLTGPKEGVPAELSKGGKLSPDEIGSVPLNDDLSGDLTQKFNLDRGALAANTVHFDFDSAVVKSSEKSKVEAVASYMRSTPGVALLVEGHCDERGTEEYNRSLGERRALALREALVNLGADASRITTRSFGEDSPVAMGHDESAWRQNRRGEFVVLHPK
jgi:peptidoglycan-associated lipoprotein